jgi:hypothetical protein
MKVQNEEQLLMREGAQRRARLTCCCRSCDYQASVYVILCSYIICPTCTKRGQRQLGM